MKKILAAILVLLIAIPICLLIAGQLGLLHGTRPTDIGVSATGQFLKAPGADALNVVSSQAALHPHTDYHVIAPLKFEGDPAQAFARLQKIVSRMEGVTMAVTRPDYMHAEFQTKLLKFVDDVEFSLNAAKGEIDMRSASRLGRKDFGVNRKRLEQIRAAFEAK